MLGNTWVSEHHVVFADKLHNLALGHYALEVAAVTRDTGDLRLVEELKLILTPGPAWHRPRYGLFGRLGGPSGVEPDPTHLTQFRLETIELQESDRTLAIIPVDRALDRGIIRIPLLSAPGAPAGSGFEPAAWARTAIILHARLLPPVSPAVALPPLQDSGRLSWIYRPQAGTVRAERARAVGRLLAPGRLEPIGSGLALFPERAYAGESFTASIILMNRGERPTETASVRWRYDERSLDAILPALPPGRDVTLTFQAIAARTILPVTLEGNAATLARDMDPLLRPRLSLGRLAVDTGFRDEPLVVRIAVGNSGTGEASRPRLFVGAGSVDTTLVLDPIPADETRIVVLTLGDTAWPETVPVIARIASAIEPEDTGRFLARRTRRPAPDLRLAGLSFEGDPVPGGAGRAAAVLENRGNVEGFARAAITIHAVPAGIEVLRVSREIRVPAGERVEMKTPIFAWANGITRAAFEWQGGTEFLQAYAEPAPFTAPDGETVLILASAFPARGIAGTIESADPDSPDAGAGVLPRRITEHWKAVLPPLTNLDELAPVGRLVVTSAAWLTNPAGTEFLPEQAAARREVRPSLKATITGAGFSDAFTVTASETQFVFPIPRAALAETLVLTLNAVGRSPVYLTSAPLLRVAYGAPERGAFSDVHVTETGLHLRVANTARWIPARALTVSAAYAEPLPHPDGPNVVETSIALDRLEERDVFIPLPRVPPGRMQLEVSLPLSSVPSAQRIEQLVLPVPRPELSPFRVIAGRARAGAREGTGMATPGTETGILVLLGVHRSPVRDLILAAQEAHMAVTIHVPAEETAVAWFPRARTASIDYGPLSDRRQVPEHAELPAPGAGSTRTGIRILDTGGDSPAGGQFVLVRFARGGEEPRPAGRVYLAINGLLRSVKTVPATAAGEAWIDGFAVRPNPAVPLDVLLFEETLPGGGAAAVAHVDRGVFPVSLEPEGASRVERDWIQPVRATASMIAGTGADTAVDAGERAAQAAWAVAAFLGGQDPTSLGIISPEPARALTRLGRDTTALGRMAYRQRLWTLVEEWQAAADRIALRTLPVTLSAARFAAFQASIARLKAHSEDVGVLNRRAVVEELGTLATHVDHILGQRLEPGLAATLRGF